MSVPEKLIDDVELSARLGIARTTLQRWRSDQREDQRPFYKLGRSIRYSWPEVLEWLRQRREESR